MVRVIHLADDGTEMASIEVDDFTIAVLYSGLAELLREAAVAQPSIPMPSPGLSREARQRRQRVLHRLRD